MKETAPGTEICMSGIEKLGFALRALYESYGYAHFRMSKFEEYDLYAANKDFLPSDGIITFTDRRGRLLALKPDITLSIIKNSTNEKTAKYYYNENVYRTKSGSDTYGELLQLGIECIGEIGVYETAETVIMAARSLAAVSDRYVLDISHMGLLGDILASGRLTDAEKRTLLKCVAGKSTHGIDASDAGTDVKETLRTLISTEGTLPSAVAELKRRLPAYADTSAVAELETLASILAAAGYADRVRLDFSVVHDRTYYNGIVMRGFIEGIPERVLSGGRYDLLLRRMGKRGGGIGFSVYADALERIIPKKRRRQTDVLVLSDASDDMTLLTVGAEKLRSSGISVTVSKDAADIEYGCLMRLVNGKLTEVTE